MQTNKIITGNCIEVMADLPAWHIDLTVTSPPYDSLRDYKHFDFDFVAIAGQLWRITKPGGVVVWIVGDQVVDGSESGSSFEQALDFMGMGFNLHDTMIYQKTGIPFPDQTRYHQGFEYMFVFSKGRPKTINLIKDHKKVWHGRWGKEVRKRKKNGSLEVNKNFEKLNEQPPQKYGVRSNVWRYSTGAGNSTKDKFAFDHPAMFPEKLAQDHIISWSNPGDVVLDPMCGSGTTCKMAKINARDYIGIEMSDEYAKIAERRVQVQSMHPLFAGEPNA